jgi:sodium/potassium/calcium exchanger 6
MAAGRTVLSSLILLVAASTCSGGSDRPHEQLSAPPTGAPRREAAAGLVGAVQQSSVASPPAKPKRARLRKACGPDDARCVALRDHECDPYYANVTDTCTFVQYNKQCAADVHHINYLALFYCRSGDGRVFAALFFLAWMGMLFWVMSKAAEDFLVPALEYLACLLRMTPDVAGVTLFAFASGAPDLFTQIAAVAAGGTVDQELAIRWGGCGRGRWCGCG